MFDKVLPITIALACGVMLIRLFLPAAVQRKLDHIAQTSWHAARRHTMALVRRRASRKAAAQAAEEAIRRARTGGQWEGNVYKPDSFKRPRKPH